MGDYQNYLPHRQRKRGRAELLVLRRHGVTIVEMLIVVTIIGLIAGISFPAVTSGIDSLRLASASDSLVSFLNGAMNRAERRQDVVEIAISIQDNALMLTSTGLSRKLEMPSGVTIKAIWPKLAANPDATRRFLLMPGGAVPRLGIEIANRKGVRRIIRVNPMTGVPDIERLAAGEEPAQ
jgi:prepilin-type N-terminal cleavage/methylation domain-containing protein